MNSKLLLLEYFYYILISYKQSSESHQVVIRKSKIWHFTKMPHLRTGKSLSEALIFASTNPQYDDRLFIELRVQYMKITSLEHVVYINCSKCRNKNQFKYTTCSELVIFMYWTVNLMNNLLSYCGLVDARISASDKYLPVN